MVGAVLGFALVGALAFGGVTAHFDRDHGEAPGVGKLPFPVSGCGDRRSMAGVLLHPKFPRLAPGRLRGYERLFAGRGGRIDSSLRMGPSKIGPGRG